MQDTGVEMPQSSVARVTYRLDTQTHQLVRAEQDVPPSQVVPTQDPTPAMLSRRVAAVSIEFTGADGSSRADWDYESQAQAASAEAGTSSVTLGQTDTTLPISARVIVTIIGSNDKTVQMESSVALSMPTPLPAGQKPAGPALGRLPSGLPGIKGLVSRRIADAASLHRSGAGLSL
jgi:hypothetical protein